MTFCPELGLFGGLDFRFSEDFVYYAIFLGLFSVHKEVSLHVFLYLLRTLASIFSQKLVQNVAGFQDVFGGYRDVSCLAFHSAQRLVNHDFRVWQDVALALFAGRENDGGSGSGDAYAKSRYIRTNVIDGVYNCHGRGHGATGGIDVKIYVLLWVFAFKEKKLGNDDVCGMVINRPAEEYDAFAEQARVDVVRPFAKLTFFNNGWN